MWQKNQSLTRANNTPKAPSRDKPNQSQDSIANSKPLADHGADSYIGSNKLAGRKALITGGDSGIGRAIAIAFAHGHLYETSRSMQRRVSKADKVVLDDKNSNYATFVNSNTLRTHNLRLHVVPSEVGISDLYRILKLWNKIYIRLNMIHGSTAWLQSYIFPDYSTHLRSQGLGDKLIRLEERLMAEMMLASRSS